MPTVFQSATVKLTAWYLGIIMAISLAFSFAIYQINFHEVTIRLENLQRGLTELQDPQSNAALFDDQIRRVQIEQAAFQMIMSLVYINLIIFLAAGAGSYILARRTLKPIEEAHEAQSRFVSDASHELRTPLAAMKTELEVSVRDTSLTKEEAKELLESSLEEVNKLIQLSEVLLKLSRLDDGSIDMVRVPLKGTLAQVLSTFKQQKERITTEGFSSLYVYGNKAALTELITILVDNALTYSKKQSTVTISAKKRGRSVMLQVHNVGKAIPKSALPKLFDRFYRADASRTNGSKNGYGLGLSIAKKIISVHHGAISVSSNKNGTTFSVTLPTTKQSS